MGDGEAAVIVIGSHCRGQAHNSQLSVIMHHSNTWGLGASARVSERVPMCVCVQDANWKVGKIVGSVFQQDGENAEQKYAEWH